MDEAEFLKRRDATWDKAVRLRDRAAEMAKPQQTLRFEIAVDVHEGPILDEEDAYAFRVDIERAIDRLGWDGVTVHVDEL